MNAWGQVIDASPLTVTFSGDAADKRVVMGNDDYTPVAGDTVLLALAGAQWVVVCKLVDR